MLDPKLLVLLHAAATLFMCGVIAIVQIVHYPLFNMVGRDQFAAYENAHTNLITLVVGPAMLLEAACVLGLLIERPGSWLAWAGAGLLGVVWFSTAFLQVPQHGILSSGFNQRAYEILVQSNWLRTLAWWARGVIACVLVWQAMFQNP
jgi:hypothetical protein